VKELVSMHQGSIQVASEGPNRGSEFTMRIPVAVSMDATGALPEADRLRV